jgi:hypothetical protein
MKSMKPLGDWVAGAFDTILCTIIVLAFILFAMSKLTDLFVLDR